MTFRIRLDFTVTFVFRFRFVIARPPIIRQYCSPNSITVRTVSQSGRPATDTGAVAVDADIVSAPHDVTQTDAMTQ
jgi:hypothetical protein